MRNKTKIQSPIAVMGLSNSTSLHIYDIAYSCVDEVLVGFNNDEPQWVEVLYTSKEDEENEEFSGFELYGVEYDISDFIRTNY